MSMYLNDFRKEIVIEVFNEIKEREKRSDLLCRGFPESIKGELAVLVYYPETHLLYIGDFHRKRALYPNPDIVCELAPKKVFVNSLSPSSDYHKMMSS